MNIEEVRFHCMNLPGTTEDFPFGDDVLAFRVGGKIYALVNLERTPVSINLKCDPARAVELRDAYDAVTPGYHMNKKHWNTVALEHDVPSDVLAGLIDHAYDLVFAKLTRRVRDALRGEHG